MLEKKISALVTTDKKQDLILRENFIKDENFLFRFSEDKKVSYFFLFLIVSKDVSR